MPPVCVGCHSSDAHGISGAADQKRKILDDSERSLVVAGWIKFVREARWFFSGLSGRLRYFTSLVGSAGAQQDRNIAETNVLIESSLQTVGGKRSGGVHLV